MTAPRPELVAMAPGEVERDGRGRNHHVHLQIAILLVQERDHVSVEQFAGEPGHVERLGEQLRGHPALAADGLAHGAVQGEEGRQVRVRGIQDHDPTRPGAILLVLRASDVGRQRQ